MTKLKKLIETNEIVEQEFSKAVKIRTEIENIKNKKEKMLLIKSYEYKTILGKFKNLKEVFNINKEIAEKEIDLEEATFNIWAMRDRICNHELLILLNKNKNDEDVNEYLCPICSSKFIRPVSDSKIDKCNIIDESSNPNKNEFFGELREVQIEFLSKMKQFIIRNEEATVDDFFTVCIEERPDKCKRKMMK